MKRTISIVLTLAMAAIVGCTAVIGVSAETTTNLGSYEVFSSDGKATFMDYSEDEVNVIIPYMVEGNPITAIAPDVFLDKVNTENICIDESSEYFTSVDGVLFTKDMSTLVAYPKNNPRTEYTVPEGVAVIAENAFNGNTHLKSVTLPEGVAALKTSCFRQCTSLEEIIIPDSVESIEGGCFNGCVSLKSFDFPANLKMMSFPVFSNCTSLTDVFLEPQHAKVFLVRILEPTAFFKEESNWENGALYKDGVLISVKRETAGEFIVKEGTKAISFGALDGTKVTSVAFPDSVELISQIALGFNSDLTKVYIPASVIEIDAHAFEGHNSDLTIYGEKGSYAEGYAAEHEIRFEALGNQETVDVLGDANGDGKLNIKDATIIQKHLAKIIVLDDNSIKLSDFNSDSKVDIKDATAIQKHLAGITSR